MRQIHAIDQLGRTQQRLLRHLLSTRNGATVEDLQTVLGITTTAVRQHIAALSANGFVAKGEPIQTGRRPQLRYVLTESGREAFPRHYGGMADKVIAQVHNGAGSEGLLTMMGALGKETGKGIDLNTVGKTGPEIADALAKAMAKVGYEASAPNPEKAEVVAFNCVFHHLAERFSEVCEYDLSLIRTVTGMGVAHGECMVRGGNACRFRLTAKNGGHDV